MTTLRRYLAAKRSVDDRALNRHVLDELRRLLPPGTPRVLEIGAGLGTMVARLLEWQVVTAGEYTLLDVDRRLLRDSRTWLCDWAARPRAAGPSRCRTACAWATCGCGWSRPSSAATWRPAHGEPADLLIANAFLDLVDVPAVLPGLLRLLVPGGAYWFTITFDGESIFQPDHPHDDAVLGAYHRSMDDRVRYGRPAGESRTGRHLFGHLRAAGAPAAVGGLLRLGRAGRPGRHATPTTRRTSSRPSSRRSRTPWTARRHRPASPTGSPSAAASSPPASWSTWPTSSTSPAGRPVTAIRASPAPAGAGEPSWAARSVIRGGRQRIAAEVPCALFGWRRSSARSPRPPSSASSSLTTGLDAAGWVRRAGRRLGGDRAAGRRPGPQRAADPPGGLDHPDPGAAERRGRGTRRRLRRPAAAGPRAGRPRLRRARARRRGRAGGAPHGDRHAVRGPLRRRGRRLPHPGAERRGVPGLRRLGAGHRRRPLRAAGRRVGGPVAGRTAAAPVLGQGRRRRPGHRPHRRGLRACCPARSA